MRRMLVGIIFLLMAIAIVEAQEYKATPVPLSQAEQEQLKSSKQGITDAQAVLDKAIADHRIAILSVLKAHGYDESYLGQRPGSPYITLTEKALIVHEVCSECQ